MSKKKKKKKDINSINKKEKIIEVAEEVADSTQEVETPSIDVPISKESVEQTLEESKEVNEEIDNINDVKDEQIDETQKQEDSSYTVVNNKKSHKPLFIVSFILLLIVLLFLIFSTVFALISNRNTIIFGIKIKDIDVSGLSKEEANKKVSDIFKEKLEEHITLKHNEYEMNVFLGQFDVSFFIEEAINMAYDKGHSRKYF